MSIICTADKMRKIYMGKEKLIKLYCKAWPEIWKCFEKSVKEALSPAGVNPSDKVFAATSTYIS